jgi:hypothetical protein
LDILQIASLYHSIWHETISAFMPAPEVARRTTAFFIDRMTVLQPTTFAEERDGTIAGFASWTGSILGQLYVAAPFRGSSTALDLLQATEQAMAAGETLEAELHCIAGNHRARRFYERRGWKYSGPILEKVAGHGGDYDLPCWRMTKALR